MIVQEEPSSELLKFVTSINSVQQEKQKEIHLVSPRRVETERAAKSKV